jgi:peptidoglycan/LPS O-acetylase OafA/YrhL
VRRITELDGIRGIAITGVIVFHLFPTTAGFLGVQIFFVLSGYLITALLLREWQVAGAISLRGFYRRRTYRILPPLVSSVAGYLVLTAVVVAATGRTSLLQPALAGAAFGLGFITNLVTAWGHHAPPTAISHLWSLSAEEQFYALWPFALIAALRRGHSRARIASGLIVVGLIVLGDAAYLIASGADGTRINVGPDSGSITIIIGCIAALMASQPRLVRLLAGRRGTVIELSGLAFLLVAILDRSIAAVPVYPAEQLVLSLFTAAIILRAVSGQSSASVLRTRWLVALGRISYGLYLWHVIVINATPWIPPLLGVAIAVAIAHASHRWLEKPLIQRGRRLSLQQPELEIHPAPAALLQPS